MPAVLVDIAGLALLITLESPVAREAKLTSISNQALRPISEAEHGILAKPPVALIVEAPNAVQVDLSFQISVGLHLVE